MPDPVSETDWAAAWGALVEARQAARTGPPQVDYWTRRAPHFAAATRQRADSLLGVLEPYLDPAYTLLDVGAGAGRHAAPLADRLDWVTAVEPSEGMRALIPDRPNLTLIGSSWEEAEAAPADLVLCAHVLYGVADVVPFLQKLASHARRRVFVFLRAGQLQGPVNRLWEELAGHARPRMPEALDLLLVLRQLGVRPEVASVASRADYFYPSLEEAVADARDTLGEDWEEARGSAWLAEHLEPAEGGYRYAGGEGISWVLHWRP